MSKTVEERAASVASMVIEWVEGGLAGGTDWRNGLKRIIAARLRRLEAPSNLPAPEAVQFYSGIVSKDEFAHIRESVGNLASWRGHVITNYRAFPSPEGPSVDVIGIPVPAYEA